MELPRSKLIDGIMIIKMEEAIQIGIKQGQMDVGR